MIESINIYICKCGSEFRDEDTSCPGCNKPTQGMTILGGYTKEINIDDLVKNSHDHYKQEK